MKTILKIIYFITHQFLSFVWHPISWDVLFFILTDHGKAIKGTILQRFPDDDFKDYPFPSAVELVCKNFGIKKKFNH